MPEGFVLMHAFLHHGVGCIAFVRTKGAKVNFSPSFRGLCELQVQPVSRDKTSFVRLFCFNPPKGGKESKDGRAGKKEWVGRNGKTVAAKLLSDLRGGIGVKWSGNERARATGQPSLARSGRGEFLPRANVLGWNPETTVALSVINLHI